MVLQQGILHHHCCLSPPSGRGCLELYGGELLEHLVGNRLEQLLTLVAVLYVVKGKGERKCKGIGKRGCV